jgi:spoIIIJ-associated protein
MLGLFGGKPAKVKVTVEIKENPADVAEKFLRDVISAMNLSELTIEVEKTDNSATFDIEGEDVGFIIGRRGETLDSLQYLTSLVANHVDNSYFKITVNTGNYREKREKTLEILGRKLAYKAVKTGKKTSLEPMNPYERRIIHTSVQKVKGAISWSEGENASRHVVIGPDPKARPRRRGGNNYNRKGSKPSAPAPNPNRKPLDESNGAGLYGRID